ncbi:VOC family protein [Chryseobacterium sp. BLS98]|uniref:VOC family protein n=1 Tax=Chryseobacterium sp. BLS98 TaxID=885586 RepID=UPI001E46FD50|nr:hypothetical protein [Chryseobacterium sp. BLS98]
MPDLEALVEQLKKEGVNILDDIETYDFGKFTHILDIEENKIGFWSMNNNEPRFIF